MIRTIREQRLIVEDLQGEAEKWYARSDYNDEDKDFLRAARELERESNRLEKMLVAARKAAERRIAKALKPRAVAFSQPAPRARRGIGSY